MEMQSHSHADDYSMIARLVYLPVAWAAHNHWRSNFAAATPSILLHYEDNYVCLTSLH